MSCVTRLTKDEFDWISGSPLLEDICEAGVLEWLRAKLPNPPDGESAQRRMPWLVWRLLNDDRIDDWTYYSEVRRFISEVLGQDADVHFFDAVRRKEAEIDLAILVLFFVASRDLLRKPPEQWVEGLP